MRRAEGLITDAGFLIAGVVATTVGGLALVLWAFVPAEGTQGLAAALALAAGIAGVAGLSAGVIALRCRLGGVETPVTATATPEAG